MPSVQKWLFLAGLGRGAYSRWRTQRAVSSIMTIIMLAVIAAVMASALAIGGIYAFYLLLIVQGIDPFLALMFTALTILLLAFGLLQMIRGRIEQLRAPLRTPVNDAIDAFLDGLFAEPRA